jgi:hypothetical protein
MQRFATKMSCGSRFLHGHTQKGFSHVKRTSYCGFSKVTFSKREFLTGYLKGMGTVRRLTIVSVAKLVTKQGARKVCRILQDDNYKHHHRNTMSLFRYNKNLSN